MNNAPPCMWSPSPPVELKGTAGEALSANAGFVTFGNVINIDSPFPPFISILFINKCSHFPSSIYRNFL